jgi:Spy/CpxP family protein refolding chaperone
MRVKEAHMGLLVRIRNLLTPEQREKLRKLRGDG